MINETYKKALWNMMDNCRGAIDSRSALDIITTVIVCAAVKKDSFSDIRNMGANSIVPALNNVIAELKQSHETAFQYCNDLNQLPDKMISDIVYTIASFESLQGFSSAIRDVCIENTGKYAEYGSTDYMAKLIPTLVGSAANKTLLDAACGLARTSGLIGAEQTYLQEIHINSVSLLSRLLLLEDKNTHTHIVLGDSLTSFAYPEKKFDLVVMEPPLGVRLHNEQLSEIRASSYIITEPGKSIPTSAGDALWIQFALHHLNDTGKAYLVLPQGSLFRGGYDAAVREYLLDNELVDILIALPSGSLSGTGIEPVLLVLNKNKQKGSPIRFVDIRDIGNKTRSHISLSEDDLAQITALIYGDIQDSTQAEDVTVREIRQTEPDNTGNNLNISRYIHTEEVLALPSVAEQLVKLEQSQQAFENTQQALIRLLNQ